MLTFGPSSFQLLFQILRVCEIVNANISAKMGCEVELAVQIRA